MENKRKIKEKKDLHNRRLAEAAMEEVEKTFSEVATGVFKQIDDYSFLI